MSTEPAPRRDDHHVEPLYAAVRAPERADTPVGPSLAVRLVLVALVALALLALVLKQAY